MSKSLPNDFISNIHNHGINPRSREIFLHGHMDEPEEPGVDYRMAATFIKNIILLNRQNSSPIFVHMSSDGGDWNSGIAIYDSIRASVAPVVIIAYAQAVSMTSIILQAGDLRLITPNCDFMIHYGRFSIADTTLGVISASHQEQKTLEVMLNIYAERCLQGEYFLQSKNPKYTLDRVKKFLDRKMKDHQEWYLNSEEAVNYGFADGVLGKEFVLNDIITNNIEVSKANWKV